MREAIPLRLDHDAAGLRGLARANEDADQVRRLLALALYRARDFPCQGGHLTRTTNPPERRPDVTADGTGSSACP
jgi:hypothetical protein